MQQRNKYLVFGTAVNDFGTSNWATVSIELKPFYKSDGMLSVIILIGASMMIATCCGMLRVISLQLLLVPYRDYATCGKICGSFCAPAPERTDIGRTDEDSKESTSNPLAD
jgi:hypothetical protein